ncbi:MAG: polysaccharide biosynthesis C-terminal domain-containing protein [Chlorobi bacterium]|nr:polysaccharide biosynthesis C-terminal domain-containing protein [Chlorobiota bacterium]MCI0714845.1 polysaccharide biosynthesis C-terminal domain-containing protein [Chlorobiota bacterium]
MLKRLAKESFVYGLSGYLSKSISLLLLPLYTAVLTTEDYGILDLLGTIITVSTFLIVSGTDTSVGYYYFRKEHFEERPVIIISSMYVRLLFSAAGFIIISFFSLQISLLLFGRDLSLFVMITGFTIVFQVLHSFLFNLLRLEFRVWLYTILSSVYVLISILLTVYYVLIEQMGVYGALIAQSIAYGMIFLFTIIYVFKRYGRSYSFDWIKKILSYGYPLIGTGVAVWVLGSTDRYFLAHYADLSSVGIYAVGAKLASIVGIIGGALQMAWSPYSLDIQYEKNAKEIYSKVFQLYSYINIVLIFVISMFSIDILKVFTQPDFYSAKAVVPFLCVSVFFTNAYFIVTVGINITKKIQHTIWITITSALVNIGLNFLLTPTFGPVGAAFCIMSANFMIFLLTYIISQKYYKINYKYRNILIMLVPASAIIFAAYYMNLKLMPRIIISGLYLVLSSIYIYFKYKDSEEFLKIVNKIKKLKSKEEAEKSRDEISKSSGL